MAWLARSIGPVEGPVYTSRFYKAEESWTGAEAWWHELPDLGKLPADGYLWLLCEKPGRSTGFYCLRVPLSFIREARLGLEATPKGYRLHLSAEPANHFQDERGPGKVRFGRFLVEASR